MSRATVLSWSTNDYDDFKTLVANTVGRKAPLIFVDFNLNIAWAFVNSEEIGLVILTVGSITEQTTFTTDFPTAITLTATTAPALTY